MGVWSIPKVAHNEGDKVVGATKSEYRKHGILLFDRAISRATSTLILEYQEATIRCHLKERSNDSPSCLFR